MAKKNKGTPSPDYEIGYGKPPARVHASNPRRPVIQEDAPKEP